MPRKKSTSTGAVYGIDLGTTYSCLAAIDGTGRPEIVPQMDGALTLPSVVLFVNANDYLTGEPARAQARALPEDVCTLAKRRMGDGEWRFVSHGTSWSAPAVSSLILRALVNNTALNTATAVQDVVITVPAYFGDEERRATRLAGEYAGLTVVDVISEPIAAALSYGFARLDSPSEAVAEEVALVYDLGGGTFDVTVVELAERRLAVVSIDGDHELGGADWDEKLAVHLSRAFLAAHPDAEDPLDDSAGSQALILAAERAKRDLTQASTTTVRVAHDDCEVDVPVSREVFEAVTRSLLDRTLELTRHAVDAARERGVRRIDRVLLVGGCSRMPAVAARLAEELGVPTQLADPDLAVAKGAAIYGEKKSVERLVTNDLVTRGQLVDGEPVSSASAADLDAACARLAEVLAVPAEQVRRTVEVQVLNVCSRGFGVMAVGRSGGLEAVFLVHRNDRLPVTVRRSFGTMYDDQDVVTVRVVEQGGGAESPDPDLSKIIAEASITEIPPGYPAGSQIEITLAMGFDGILELTARHEGLAERPLKTQIETSAALSQADVARERAQVARVRNRDPR
ncbi:MAG TPA: Hsp70 family protein [Kineosporiaceae bacterium]|nr:Hsp70 family protein [Kineosporiaceae bacterium]